MKNKIIVTSLLIGSLAYGQVNLQAPASPVINQENPFLDASGYVNAKNNVGKGLYFPKTDLTQWEFKLDRVDPGTFSNYFDGMIVYNSGTGKTIADETKGGKQIDITPGFYYFKNPNQTFPDGSVENGYWVKLIESDKNGGVRLTNMTTQERDAMRAVPKGIMIFNTDANCAQVWDGISWSCMEDIDGKNTPMPDMETINPNENPSQKGTFKLTGFNDAYILSVYDDHYLPFVDATEPAALGSLNASNRQDPLMNYQGRLDNAKSQYAKKIIVNYECQDGPCNYPNIVKSTTISADYLKNKEEDAEIKLAIYSGEVPTGTGEIIGTIFSNELLEFEQLDINKGLGAERTGIKIATFSGIPDFTGSELTEDLYLIPGILDRMQGKMTNGVYEHEFAYLPIRLVIDPEKNFEYTFLNLNLGADYANINSPYFNPAKKWEENDHINDFHAYGSVFQWGRKPDGFELIHWTSPSTGKSKYDASGFSMKKEELTTYNESCPAPFKTPNLTDWTKVHSRITGAKEGAYYSNNDKMWTDTILNLPANVKGEIGAYWSSRSLNDGTAMIMWFNNSTSNSYFNWHKHSPLPVRCFLWSKNY
ncbi:hypothetical protein KRX57_10600 [Weeksellaceae bacterium TAE3-ERU29]|nr:hypothetical protein [Weeksellaceae bacterium TAE3-ERU29]